MTLSRIALSVALAATLFSGSATADKIKVGKGGIDTIQAAIAAALANADADDTILVPSGVYDESVFVTLTGQGQDSLTITKTGKGEVLIRGTGNDPAIRVANAARVRLSDLTLESGGALPGVPALEVSGTVVDMVAESLRGVAGDQLGVAVVGTSPMGVLFDDCDFSGMLESGFLLDGSRHRLKDSTADSCGQNAVVLAPTSSRCRIEGLRADQGNASDGTNEGVVTVRGDDHVLTDCRITGGDRGFAVYGEDHVLTKCEASGASGPAFALEGGRVRLQDCEGTSSLHGVSGGGDGVQVLGGSFDGNSSHGIFLRITGESTVEGVNASSNGGNGVMVLYGVSGPDVLFSTMKANNEEAVRVEGDHCWVEGNTGKKGDGFVDAGAENMGRDNAAASSAVNDFP